MPRNSLENYKLTAEMYCNNVLSFVLALDAYVRNATKNIRKIPFQPVLNKLQIFQLPHELRNARRHERVLISRRILFKKITIMPKGQSPKLKGALCNTPIEMINISDVLPRQADSNGIVLVKPSENLNTGVMFILRALCPIVS